MRVGVTGATGFIGKNLVKNLIKNHFVVKALVVENDPDLPFEVECVQGDLVSDTNVDIFLSGVDILIHLAGRFNPPDDQIFMNNVVGTYNLAKHIANSNVKQIIFMSSVAVYGMKSGKKFRENDRCIPDSVYGLSKYLSEEIFLECGRKGNTSITIFRSSNVYGPENFQGIVYSLYSDIYLKKGALVYGDGSQKRSFLYIDDLVELFLLVVRKPHSGIFNVSSLRSYSVTELLSVIRNSLNLKFKIDYDLSKKPHVYNINQDIKNVISVTGWTPKTSLNEGIKKTFKWYLNRLIK